MNPFTSALPTFFGKNKNLLGMNSTPIKGWTYIKMMKNRIKKRRAKNKVGRKSRRINRIIRNL